MLYFITTWLAMGSLLLGLCSCKDSKQTKKQALSYEEMSGRGLECWKNILTPEDHDNFLHYKNMFENRLPCEGTAMIPKVLHLIWLGPKDFPRESIANIVSWVEHHPGWKVKFWSDRKRPLPIANAELILVSEDLWNVSGLSACYHSSDNFGERSDILRYQILYNEGGLYVDHDVRCLRAFDELAASYELFCGLELPSDTPVTSSIHAANGLIGSRAGHPVLKEAMVWLPEHWQEIESLYPGRDKDSIIRRVAARSFASFALAVRSYAGVETRDMVFPAMYFNAPTDDTAIYARHLYAGSWFTSENPFEKMARSRLMLLSKKVNKIMLLLGVSVGVNLLAVAGLAVYLKRKVVGKA
jgi:hypothetical protein